MAYQPFVQGQQVMASSQGVVIASNQTPVSVAGTVLVGNTLVASVSGTTGASVIGTVPVTQSGAWSTSVVGTVSVIGTVSVVGSIGITGNPSISGTVNIGNVVTVNSVYGNISGSVAATITNTNLNVSGSVAAFLFGATIPPGSVSGTVTANQGTNAGLGSRWPVIISNGTQTANVTAASMLSVSVDNIPSISGTVTVAGIPSIATTQQGTWRVSVAGTYATGAASIISGLGLLTFGVRNDTLASVLTTGDGGYSPVTVGAVGEVMTAPAPITAWVNGVASCFTGVEQPVIVAQAAGVFTYVNAMQVTNQAGTAARVTFRSSAGGTILANIIVPANGGFSFNIPTGLKTIAAGAFTASINAVASVYINAQGFISKT